MSQPRRFASPLPARGRGQSSGASLPRSLPAFLFCWLRPLSGRASGATAPQPLSILLSAALLPLGSRAQDPSEIRGFRRGSSWACPGTAWHSGCSATRSGNGPWVPAACTPKRLRLPGVSPARLTRQPEKASGGCDRGIRSGEAFSPLACGWRSPHPAEAAQGKKPDKGCTLTVARGALRLCLHGRQSRDVAVPRPHHPVRHE